MKKTRIRLSLFSLVLALVLFGLTIRLTGRDPLVVYWSIHHRLLRQHQELSECAGIYAPLIMTGLGAAVAFQSGVFNIGGEGQVLVGGLASVIVGLTVPLPAPWGWLLALLAGFAAGALWALLPTPVCRAKPDLTVRGHHYDELHRRPADGVYRQKLFSAARRQQHGEPWLLTRAHFAAHFPQPRSLTMASLWRYSA